MISLICPTFNGLDLLKQTLPPLLQALKSVPHPTELILVDNGSTDGTEEYLRGLSKDIRYFRFSKNEGFSKACNRGAGESTGEYLFFVNNDILAEGDFLSPLLKRCESNPSVFAAGPKFLRWDRKTLDDGMRNPVYTRGLLDVTLQTETLDTAQPMVFFCGGGFLVSRKKFLDLGGFDEIYTPFAWEDLDLGYRAVKRGYVNCYCPEVTLYHKREATSKAIFSPTLFKAIVWRNKFIFMWSNFTDLPLFLNHAAWLPWKLLKFLCSGRWPYVLGFFKTIPYWRRVFRKRHLEKPFLRRPDKIILDGSWKEGILIS